MLLGGRPSGDPMTLGNMRGDRPYRSGRSPHWIKVKNQNAPQQRTRLMRFDRRRKLPIKSSVVKHSMIVNGRDSSVSIEGAFWNALKEIAVAQNISANALVSKIDRERDVAYLSSAIRVYVVEHYRRAANASGDPQRPG
jgi:predicted DNA-binding ribbon-helix-helix protein